MLIFFYCHQPYEYNFYALFNKFLVFFNFHFNLIVISVIKIVVFAMVVYAVILQTYEGAFAQGPGLEAHGIE